MVVVADGHGDLGKGTISRGIVDDPDVSATLIASDCGDATIAIATKEGAMPSPLVWPSDVPRPRETDECDVVLRAGEIGGDPSITADTNAADGGGAPTILVAGAKEATWARALSQERSLKTLT